MTTPRNNDANQALQAAMRCHQEGRIYDAELHYARALELEPDNVQALRLRGVLARERGDVELALQLLRKATELQPSSAEPQAEIALTLMMAGDLQGAEDAFRDALTLAPNAIDTLANFGALLQHRGHLKAAIDVYREILAQDAGEIEIRCNLAKALADRGDTAAALAEVDTAIEQSGGRRGSYAARGAVLIDAGRYADAATALQLAVEHNPPDDMALVNLALCCHELGDTSTANGWLTRAVELNPHNARAVSDLVTNLSALDNHAEAIALAESFLGEYPAERLVIGSYAQALLNAGRQDEARHLTDSAQLIQVFDLPAPDAFASADQFHAALAAELRNDPSLVDNPVSKSTAGGQQTGELNLQQSLAMRAFAEMANATVSAAADTYLERGLSNHPVMLPAAKDWRLRAWGTLIDAGGQQTPHMHPLGWLSAVYYVELPSGMTSGGAHAGWLEFGQPPARMTSRVESPTRCIEPVPGRLVIFPSWFWHRTLPFTLPAKSDAQRISIAFDVMPFNRKLSSL